MTKRRDAHRKEVRIRLIRQSLEAGLSVSKIAKLVDTSYVHTRRVILQNFPELLNPERDQ